MNRKLSTVLIAGGVLLSLSSFAFARRKPGAGLATGSTGVGTEGLTFSDGSVTLPGGQKVDKNRKLFSNQETGTPMVHSPSQIDDVALQKYKGEYVGMFTGKTALDRRFFPEGMQFLQVQLVDKSYWVSVFHVTV